MAGLAARSLTPSCRVPAPLVCRVVHRIELLGRNEVQHLSHIEELERRLEDRDDFARDLRERIETAKREQLELQTQLRELRKKNARAPARQTTKKGA